MSVFFFTNFVDSFKTVIQFTGLHTLHRKYFTSENALRLFISAVNNAGKSPV
jgi:hypothetical protein